MMRISLILQCLCKLIEVYGMLIGTLGASLLGNLLTGKGILRAGSGNKKGKTIVRAGTGKEWDF